MCLQHKYFCLPDIGLVRSPHECFAAGGLVCISDDQVERCPKRPGHSQRRWCDIIFGGAATWICFGSMKYGCWICWCVKHDDEWWLQWLPRLYDSFWDPGSGGKFQNILGLGLGCLDVSCMARFLSVFLTKFQEAKTAKREREKRIRLDRLTDLIRFFCVVSVSVSFANSYVQISWEAKRECKRDWDCVWVEFAWAFLRKPQSRVRQFSMFYLFKAFKFSMTLRNTSKTLGWTNLLTTDYWPSDFLSGTGTLPHTSWMQHLRMKQALVAAAALLSDNASVQELLHPPPIDCPSGSTISIFLAH